ncbi:MAG: hypothetical protein LC797_06495, partial [Chloroflexi bacterium]|nr:hypothetical protein [Chloroflexota bacterium]
MVELRRIGRILVIVGAVIVAGCRDDGVAPLAPAASLMASRGTNGGGAVDTAVTEFRVWAPRGGIFTVGGEHIVIFPMSAICDPATSGYGREEWDAACTPATGSVLIRARSWRSPDGHPRIEFEPALRFVPSATVRLEMRDRVAARMASGFSILSCDTEGCYDESLADASLATH